METQTFDLVLAADWEYDRDFIGLIDRHARGRGLTTLMVWPENLEAVLASVTSGEVRFGLLVDRAAGATPGFLKLQQVALEKGYEVLEPVERLRWASDKATMHLEFIANGLNTPYTVILPSFQEIPDLALPEEALVPVGRPFIVKPANTTGGSLGVVDGAESFFDVSEARRLFPFDKYLVQEKVKPYEEGSKRFYFRGFYCLGLVQCTWWNDLTHAYAELTQEETAAYGLEALFSIVGKIAEVSQLRFFSTEIVRDARGKFIVIDYVNDSCDMRLQSVHSDGVPDAVVGAIARWIAGYAKRFMERSSG